MEIVEKNIDEVLPYANNPRNNDEAVPLVANSIKQFGWQQPIVVDKDNVIIAGHTRWQAAQELGLKKVPCVVADGLTDEQIKAYRLADNKTAERAAWDFEALDAELADIGEIDMSDFGFDMDATVGTPEDVTEDEYEPPEVPEPKVKRGEIYQLGEHRLLCGDATKAEDFELLMDGTVAEIAITSPPYNASHMDIPLSEARGGGVQKGTQRKYINDDGNRTDAEYNEFLCENIKLLLENAEEIFYNVGVASGSKTTVAEIMYEFRDNLKDLLYWEKQNPMPVIQEHVISSSNELIMAFGKNNSRAFKHFNDRLFHGVITGMSAALSNEYADIHKATFPVYMPAEIISRFTSENGTVLDCFGGTGTTMVAAEELGRRCYMLEIEPAYCDVIIDRWEKFTGQKAVKVTGE